MLCKKESRVNTTVVLEPCTIYLLLYCTTCTMYLSVGCIVICSNVSRLLWLVVSLCRSEDVDVKALITFWLQSHTPSTEPPPSFESWISDYFYPTLEWVLSAGNQVVDTIVTGLVVNGLTHVHQAQSKTQIVCGLIRGLVGNLT